MNSMTGFGQHEQPYKAYVLKVSIRSVNNRGLQIHSRLPDGWGGQEPMIQKLIRRRIHRGSVECQLHCSRSSQDNMYRMDTGKLKSYFADLSRVQQEIGIRNGLNLGSLCGLPGVIQEISTADIMPSLRDKQVKHAVTCAINDLVTMREREGAVLKRALTHFLRKLEQGTRKIEARSPYVVTAYRRRLKSRIQDLARKQEDIRIAEADLAREIIIFADRSDISEELCRIHSHIAQFTKTMEDPAAIGKKLEFINQELLREMNTIGSKAGDVQISKWAIDCKVILEKLREQIQNVE